jgi:hypothetical protein
MADVNLPDFKDLASMEFMSPMAFQQANNQIGLANQFQQQNLAMGEADLRTKALANMFAEQANPLKVQQLGLTNEGMGFENTTKRVQAETDEALKEENIMAKRQKMLADLDENKLKQFMSRAEMEMMSDDPKLQASGQKKIMMSRSELERRNKHADEMEKVKQQGANSLAVANVGAGATLGAARIGADSRIQAATAKAKGVMDFDSAVAAGKITPDKALVYAAVQAQNADNPEDQAKWIARAKQFEQIVQNKASASKVGTPDVGAMANVPTIQPQSAFQGNGATGSFAPPPASTVPQGAVDMLKKNPALRQKFDEKYGAGASKRILGN